MIKAIGYAYPTSTLAQKLSRYREGCYYVETKRNENCVNGKVYGPFATKADAESHAVTIDCEWSRFTMRTSDVEWTDAA